MIDGREIHALITELYPICRSITGAGLRQTLDIIGRLLPLERVEVPSGTAVLDWTVPLEWNIRDAYIADAAGRRLVDFQRSSLHVVNYSTPVRARLSLAELRPHLHTLPDHPDWIPYRTSYYAESWGFCLSQRQLDALPDGEYDVCIDSTLAPGHLSYGERVLPGELEDEILISTHVCHPSLADDNLSGVAISVLLARALADRPGRRHTLRFLYAPGTIGAITWLAQNRERAGRIKHGLTLTCLGDGHPFTYKKTVNGDAIIDRAATHVLAHVGFPHQTIDFFPYGYDERQYGSPGFRLPVGSLMRGRHGQFPEYHTSGDDLAFVSPDRLADSARVLAEILDVLEGNRRYRNLEPYGEPQLGRRGLYRAMGGTDIPDLQLAMLWVLNLSDGGHRLLDIAERAKMPFASIKAAADLLAGHGLLATLD
jgi:aminopeptidase-like protein